jgi:hypothetical protein
MYWFTLVSKSSSVIDLSFLALANLCIYDVYLELSLLSSTTSTSISLLESLFNIIPGYCNSSPSSTIVRIMGGVFPDDVNWERDSFQMRFTQVEAAWRMSRSEPTPARCKLFISSRLILFN